MSDSALSLRRIIVSLRKIAASASRALDPAVMRPERLEYLKDAEAAMRVCRLQGVLIWDGHAHQRLDELFADLKTEIQPPAAMDVLEVPARIGA